MLWRKPVVGARIEEWRWASRAATKEEEAAAALFD
jgi:hypothetical protein